MSCFVAGRRGGGGGAPPAQASVKQRQCKTHTKETRCERNAGNRQLPWLHFLSCSRIQRKIAALPVPECIYLWQYRWAISNCARYYSGELKPKTEVITESEQ
jgi:hypothetical protein